MGSKLFPSVKYTFHSIYSNTSPSTKHKLQNNLFKHTLGGSYVHIPILLLHSHFHLSKLLCHNTIQTIQLHILFQWDQNYFLQSNILFTQYILTPVHPLNTSYIIIYLNILWVSLCPHIHFTPPWPFPPVQNVMLQLNSKYSTTHIISMGSKLFPSVKYTFHSIYSNTSPSTKHNLWNNLFKTHFGWVYVHISILLLPFPSVQIIMSQHNSNYSPTHIISMGSKLFPSVKYTFHSIYSNTSPSTKHNLW